MERSATLGARLRQIMEERGLNYEGFGQLLGQRPQTLNRYVLGQREPKASAVTQMAEILEVDPLWLQGYDVPREPRHLPGSDVVTVGREVAVPILGVIRAGIPTLAQQEILGYAAADVPRAEEYFYLRVAGDSMKNAGIQEGDLILLHQQSCAENGQIAACILGSEDATLKRFRRQGDLVILQPENPAYDPRIVPVQEFETGRARILGVAVKLVREL